MSDKDKAMAFLERMKKLPDTNLAYMAQVIREQMSALEVYASSPHMLIGHYAKSALDSTTAKLAALEEE